MHKFNGWADKFLVTPVDGLQDLYVSVSGSRGAFSWVGAYHEFSAATGTVRYGTELDGQLGFRSSWQQGFFVRGAYYGAQEFATNTLKIWLYTTYTF